MQMHLHMHMRMAARMSSTATATALHQAPLRLIALPLCRNPDLVYYLPHKARSNDVDVTMQAGTSTGTDTGKGKERDLGAGTSTDHSTAHRERSAMTEQQSGSGGNVGGGGGSDLADRIAALVSKATNKATEQWEKFGKAKPGNWKYRIYMTGENLMDRIEYEEWLLKALDASTAPKLFTRRPQITDAGADAASSTRASVDGSGSREKSVPEPLIPLYYPEKLVSEQYVLADLRRMVDLREPHHKSLMKKSLVAAPLTFPFAIIPVVPNFPLFYVLWRAWSHWRAMKSSQYLKQLLGAPSSSSSPGASHLVPSASGVLAEVYSRTGGGPFASTPPSSKADSEAGPGGAHGRPEILLDHAMVDKLVEQFELEDQARVDLRRAISQLEARLKKGQGQESGR